MVRKLFPALAVLLALASASVSATGLNRGPSTPEERKQALDYIQDYLANPIGPSAHKERDWVTRWVLQVPDVHIGLCMILENQPKGESKDADAISAAVVLAQTAFAIQNPDAKPNSQQAYLAGIEGALRVYEALLKARPEDRQPYLDSLLQKRNAGALPQFVEERSGEACKK